MSQELDFNLINEHRLHQALAAHIEPSDLPKDILRKSFSSVRCKSKHSLTTLRKFQSIGAGSFGTIYEWSGTPFVLKRESHMMVDEPSWTLWDEFMNHRAIDQAWEKMAIFHPRVKIPKLIDYIPSTRSEWWNGNLCRFPDFGCTPAEATDLLVSDRIFPLPEIVREQLIELYCKPEGQKAARQSQGNKSCLARVYLGKTEQGRVKAFFNLQNFKLTLGMMEDLHINTVEIAEVLGEALAIMHWVAFRDGRDIEFVFGGRPVLHRPLLPSVAELEKLPRNTDVTKSGIPTVDNFRECMIQIYCLDFNQCRKVSLDAVGVAYCVEAYCVNDPYYPRPSQPLWTTFTGSYLATVERAVQYNKMDRVVLSLAEQFIRGCEDGLASRCK